MSDTTTTTLRIPFFNVDAARERMGKFINWCVREGLPAPRITEQPCTIVYMVPQNDSPDSREVWTTGEERREVAGIEFIVDSDLLRLPNDWQLAAVVTATDTGIITTHAPNAPVVPAEIIGDGTRCDHCECTRRRTETFVLCNNAGEFRMVGRNCVRAYLGIDPARWATYLKGFECCNDLAPTKLSSEDAGWSVRVRCDLDVHLLLAASMFIVRKRGQYFKVDPDGRRATPSTRDEVSALLNPYPTIKELRDMGDHNAMRAFMDELKAFESDSAVRVQALDARRHFATADAATALDADMQAIARAGVVPPRSFGLACWMGAAYLRFVGELQDRQREQPVRLNEYVGATGERIDLKDCTIVHSSQHATQFGYSTLLIAYTADGRRLKCWYSGGGEIPAKGERCDVRATIKATEIDQRDQVKVTLLTRAKFTNIVPETEVAA